MGTAGTTVGLAGYGGNRSVKSDAEARIMCVKLFLSTAPPPNSHSMDSSVDCSQPPCVYAYVCACVYICVCVCRRVHAGMPSHPTALDEGPEVTELLPT